MLLGRCIFLNLVTTFMFYDKIANPHSGSLANLLLSLYFCLLEIPGWDEDNSLPTPLLPGHSVSVACRKKNVQFGI